MNNTSSGQSGIKSCSGTAIWSGVLLLIIGLVIGVFGSKHFWQKSATVAVNNEAQPSTTPPLAAQSAVATSASSPGREWDPLPEINKMQAQIDQVFQQSLPQFRNGADMKTVEGQITAMQGHIDDVFKQSFAQFDSVGGLKTAESKPGYSLSMDVRDLKDKYQVRAFLPDTKASDVKVKLNGDELKVDVANKTSEKATARNGETAMTEWGRYEEVVQLAGPLKDSQMTVQHLPHELVISVPKA